MWTPTLHPGWLETCARGYDVLSAHEAGNANASDVEQMAFAVTEDRALLTCNSGDFTAIFEWCPRC